MSDVALRFGATDDGLTAQFRRVSNQLSNFEREAGRVGAGVSRAFTSLGAAVAGVSFAAITRQLIQFSEEIKGAAERTGISMSAIQRLGFVASQTGAELTSITKSVNRLQLSLVTAGEGSAQAEQALGRLGIPVQDFIRLAPDQQFERVAQRIASIEDPAQRAAAAIGLFGRSGADLLPTLLATGNELEKLDRAFVTIGGPVSDKAIKQVDQIGSSFGATALAAKSLGTELLAIISPVIVSGLDGLSTLLGSIRFAARGFKGDNEAVNLSNQIDDLTNKAIAFKNALNPEGRRRFKEISDEIAVLQRQLDALNETGSFIAPKLTALSLDTSGIKAPSINGIPSGPREPTPEERRVAADAKMPYGFDFSAENFELAEVANQAHIDELVRQWGEFATIRVDQESVMGSALAALRQEYGVQEINFEELKSATITDIQASLATSGLQIATALFGQNKKVALAVAAINIAVAATEALKLPFPANLAAVAKVLAQGAQLTQRIRSTSIGGGGGFGGGAAGGGAVSQTTGADNRPVAEGASDRSATNIYITGYIGDRQVKEMIDRLRTEMDRDVVLIPANSRQAIELRGA